jgi:hypothetical protein
MVQKPTGALDVQYAVRMGFIVGQTRGIDGQT